MHSLLAIQEGRVTQKTTSTGARTLSRGLAPSHLYLGGRARNVPSMAPLDGFRVSKVTKGLEIAQKTVRSI